MGALSAARESSDKSGGKMDGGTGFEPSLPTATARMPSSRAEEEAMNGVDGVDGAASVEETGRWVSTQTAARRLVETCSRRWGRGLETREVKDEDKDEDKRDGWDAAAMAKALIVDGGTRFAGQRRLARQSFERDSDSTLHCLFPSRAHCALQGNKCLAHAL